MNKKKYVLGILLGAILVISGLVFMYFIDNIYEWRPSLAMIDVGIYSTTTFTADLWGIGEQYRGTYLLQTVGNNVVYGSSPKLKVYDQTENLIFSVVLQPPLFQNINIDNSGCYTFVLEDIHLGSSCYLRLSAYRNERVYPYRDLWWVGFILAFVGVGILGINLRKTLKK